MRFSSALFILALLLTPMAATAQSAAPASQAASPAASPVAAPTTLPPNTFADLAARLSPAVVNISTTQIIKPATDGADQLAPELMPMFPPGSPFEDFFKDFFERHGGLGQQPNAPRRATSLGSGFVIDSAGYILTNNHVIENADEVKVTLQDNTELTAEIIGRDPKTDLALLKVKPTKALTAVPLGDSDTARVGDWVLAIGNPFGLGGTVTQGIISARARDINAGPYDDFIQTDASINRGNSGGPLFNLNGEVVGINTAIFSPSGGSVGIGFSIPINLAKPIIAQLKEHGSIKRGWIGVRIQSVTDEIASSLGLPKASGALISSVEPEGPAAKAGLRQGDVVLSFNGKEVTEMRRLPRLVAETTIGSTATLEVWRDGKAQKLNVRVGQLPTDDKLARGDDKKPDAVDDTTGIVNIEAYGLKVATITQPLRQRFELDARTRGVVIVEVDGTADASAKGLQAGDVILEAWLQPISSATQFAEVAKQAAGGKRPLLLLLERAGDARFVAIAPVKK